jgi:hypothetical protein
VHKYRHYADEWSLARDVMMMDNRRMDIDTPNAISQALHHWPFAVWLRTSAYAYPVLETLHIVAIATTFGTILVVDLRLLGIRMFGLANFAANALSKSLIPLTLMGFALAASTGSFMFIARASDLISNKPFIAKVMLISAAGLNAALLHSRGPLDASSGATRMQAGLSLVIWLAVIACGRWIAYV